jgi:branched-chain amino acid transport system ATP-binding protein
MTLLRLNDVSVNYGPVKAVDSVSLYVDDGELVALVGTNGAGKSSLLKSIIGVVSPASGAIVLSDQQHLERKRPYWTARHCGVAYVAEDRNIFGRMSVRENVLLGLYVERRRGKQWIKESLDMVYSIFPRLVERLKQPAGTLSGGEQQMVVMARALVSRPTLLLLDEPSLGLAPLIVESIFERLTNIREMGTGILLVEQNSKIALDVSERGYVMEGGQIALEGPSDDLANDPRVEEVYLGLGEGK